MLSRIGSDELAEWMAYEQAFGPLDDAWRDDMFARLHEIQQGDPVQRNPRPNEIYKFFQDQQDREEAVEESISPEEQNKLVIAKMNDVFDGR